MKLKILKPWQKFLVVQVLHYINCSLFFIIIIYLLLFFLSPYLYVLRQQPNLTKTYKWSLLRLFINLTQPPTQREILTAMIVFLSCLR